MLSFNHSTLNSARRTKKAVGVFSLAILGRRAVLFGQLKQQLGGRRFHSNEEVEVAIHECLRMQKSYCYGDGIFEVVPRWNIYSNVSVIALKNDTSVEQMNYI